MDTAPVSSPVDADQHLVEPRGMWADHIDPCHRHLALDLVDDDNANPWLTAPGGQRIEPAIVHVSGDVVTTGRRKAAIERGEPADVSYDDLLDPATSDPAARLAALDRWEIDEAVCFPNFGLLLDRPLADRPDVLHANQRAWNRWAAGVRADSGDRLHPVAHVSLRDLDRLDLELASVAAAGLRLAMVPPSLVDGQRLSHPDLDDAWAAFCHHGVTPCFHVAAFPHPFGDAWYEDDPDQVNPVLDSVFLWTPAALCLADLAIHGVFERHPDLRIGVMELSAAWFGSFLLMVDGGFDFHARFNGAPLTELPRRPSSYLLERVRVAAFAYEDPATLIEQVGTGTFMFCSDWPHAEGIPHPLDDYTRATAGRLDDVAGANLYRRNIDFLLRR